MLVPFLAEQVLKGQKGGHSKRKTNFKSIISKWIDRKSKKCFKNLTTPIEPRKFDTPL